MNYRLRKQGQRGAALIIAMLVFALATTLVVAMSSEFTLLVKRGGNSFVASQAYAYLRGGEDLRVPAAFLRGVARNLLLGARRRERRNPPVVSWLDAVDEFVAAEPEAIEDARVDALRMCMEIAQVIRDEFPGRSLSGIGGIESGTDAAQFLLLGADTVQVCTGVMKFGYGCAPER